MNFDARIILSTIAFLITGIQIAPTSLAQKVAQPTYRTLLRTLLDEDVPHITVSQLAHMEPKPLLLDSREREEFEVSHIPGALWIGYEDFSPSRLESIPISAPVVVYCAIGYRSEQIAEQLRQMGYHAQNLYGGLFEWVNQHHSVVNSHGEPTQRAHAYNRVWGIWLREGQKVYAP